MHKVKLGGLDRKNKFYIIGIYTIFICFFIYIFYEIQINIKNQINAASKESIMSMNERGAVIVEKTIYEKQNILTLICEGLDDKTTTSQKVDYLKHYASVYNFYNMGIILPDGTCYTTLGETLDLSQYDYYQKGFQGQRVITENMKTEQEDILLNIFIVPVMKDGHVEYLLSACYRSLDFATMTNINSLFDEVQSVLIDSKGKVVTYMSQSYDSEYQKLLETIDASPEIIPDSNTDTNFYELNVNNKEYICSISKTTINDWYYMSIYEKDAAFLIAKSIGKFSSLAVGVLLVISFLASLCFFIIYHKFKNKSNEIIYVDQLTSNENYEYGKLLFDKMDNQHNIFVIAMDIDNFATLNLANGKKIGDKVLQYIIRICKEELPQDHIFREHSDCFVLLIQSLSKKEVVDKIWKIINRKDKDISHGRIVPFDLSFGITQANNEKDLHTLYTDAILAKAIVKKSSNIKYAFFDDSLRKKHLNELMINASFMDAIKNEEFQVYYQPKYDMRTNQIIGAEALVRWVKSDQNVISPANFIPCFEDSGKIVELDNYIIERVCQEMHQMILANIDIKHVSINLSRLHLKNPDDIIYKIKNYINKYAINPKNLSFEMTESAFYHDSVAINKIVEELHSIGCQVDIDDYGTGMSGLQTLSNINFDTIKLDRSFIVDLKNIKTKKLIQSTIDMVSSLGVGLIIEGVETKEQVDFLLASHCYYAQGYYFCKPITKAEYEMLLLKQKNAGHTHDRNGKELTDR